MKIAVSIALTTLSLMAGASSAEAVRQRFVPAPPGASEGNRASFSMLRHLPMNGPGVSMVMAHAGVGESFPVQEEHGPKVFDVVMVAGNDDLLKLEVRRPERISEHALPRDGTVWLQVAGEWFSISYPSVTVSSKDRPTSQQVMVIVHRYGK